MPIQKYTIQKLTFFLFNPNERDGMAWMELNLYDYPLETVQDFLIKLDIKPLMHLLEISTFSLLS